MDVPFFQTLCACVESEYEWLSMNDFWYMFLHLQSVDH